MKDWHTWVIGIITVGVWILSSLYRARQEDPESAQPRGPSGGGAGPSRPRRPANDLERFLEEINRRRQKDEPEPAEARPRSTPPARKAGPQAPTRRRPGRASQPASQRQPQQRPALESTPVAALAVESPAEVLRTVQDPKPLQPGPDAPTVTASKSSPVLGQLASLLRSHKAIQAAIVLQEVVAQPLCRRRH